MYKQVGSLTKINNVWIKVHIIQFTSLFGGLFVDSSKGKLCLVEILPCMCFCLVSRPSCVIPLNRQPSTFKLYDMLYSPGLFDLNHLI